MFRSIVPWIKSYGTNPTSGEVNGKQIRTVERIFSQKIMSKNVPNKLRFFFFQFSSNTFFSFLPQKLEAKSLTKLNYAKNNDGKLIHSVYSDYEVIGAIMA